MPYIPHLNTIVLEIPKSGSTSLAKAASTLGQTSRHGHLRASEYGIHSSRIIAVTRDPVDRLVSAINYYYQPSDIDTTCRHIMRHRMHQAAFKPQSWFMDMPDIEVYPLDRISDALDSIGYVGDAPRENTSDKWLTKDEALSSSVFRRLMRTYDSDFAQQLISK